VAVFVPCPERIFTLQPPQSVKPGNVNVRFSFFSRMNQPRMFLALAAVLWTTTYSALALLWPTGTTPGTGRIFVSWMPAWAVPAVASDSAMTATSMERFYMVTPYVPEAPPSTASVSRP
jgi:hypothetical protein